MEDTQKKLDKALKRNLENKPVNQAVPPKTETSTDLPEEEPITEQMKI